MANRESHSSTAERLCSTYPRLRRVLHSVIGPCIITARVLTDLLNLGVPEYDDSQHPASGVCGSAPHLSIVFV
jgi:hypothetical protein